MRVLVNHLGMSATVSLRKKVLLTFILVFTFLELNGD